MARDIQINFSADVDQVIAGGDDIAENLANVREKLKQVAADSVTTFDEMTDAQKDAFREQFSSEADFHRAKIRLIQEETTARREAGDKYVDFTKDANREIQRSAEETADEVGKSGEKGFGKATTAAKQAGSEIGEGLKDVVTDFDGSMQSIGSGVSNTLSGVAAIIPGIGGFIGAALASVAGGLFKTWDDNAKKTEERVKAMYDNLLESGQNFQTREQISKAVNDFTGDPGKMSEAASAATILGQSITDVTIAFVTDGPQRDAAISRLNDLIADNAAKAEAASGSNPRYAQSLANAAVPLKQLADKLDGFNKTQDDALYRTQINRRAQEDITQTFTEQGAAVDDVSRAVDELPHGKTIKVDVDTSAVDRFLQNPKTLRIDAQVFTRDGKRWY